jgi:hypothetical protein
MLSNGSTLSDTPGPNHCISVVLGQNQMKFRSLAQGQEAMGAGIG